MSNRVTVQYTIFVDLDSDGNEVGKGYGYRVYDDYQAEYNNGFGSFEEVQKKVSPENILEFLKEEYPDFWESAKLKGGLYLNDNWLDLEEEG